MHVHILGICGTFMGSLALIARELGHRVTGSDQHVYPPMSTQLQDHGIELMQGYCVEHLQPAPDLVIVGNAMSRGNAAIEYMLDNNLPYTSGPQWLSNQVLNTQHVLAVSGTHGKTSTASMLAWVLEYADLDPGFLIGGVPSNFGVSARAGNGQFFVIEADEYDTAFFDKRSKFVHYRPTTLIINNLEFDHADIFSDLAAIQTQFHHLVRIVPGKGHIIYPAHNEAIDQVLEQGCWSEKMLVGPGGVESKMVKDDGSSFEVKVNNTVVGELKWGLLGQHNVLNALAVIAAATTVGVTPTQAIEALSEFKGIKRRLELAGEVNDIKVYDDFAHHPTAIATTLDGLRKSRHDGKIIAVIEPRSNTMRMGVHDGKLGASASQADAVYWYQPSEAIDLVQDVQAHNHQYVCSTHDEVIASVTAQARPGDVIVIMSNGGFGGIHRRILDALAGQK